MSRTASNDPPVQLAGALSGKSLTQQVLHLAMWPFLQNLMGTVVSFVDMMISGRMKAEHITHGPTGGDVAGSMVEMMGLVMYVGWLLMILQSCVGTGAQALVARAMGGRNRSLASQTFGQSVLLGIVAGCIAGAVIYFSSGLIHWIPSMTSGAKHYGQQYIMILSFSAPFSGVLFAVSSCLRATGDAIRPFMAMLLVNVVNAICSFLFVFGPEGIGGWGAQGIAAGTVVAWFVGALMVLYISRKKQDEYGVDDPMVLEKKYLRFDWALSKRILRVAFPNVIEVMGMWLCHAVGYYYVTEIGRRLLEQGSALGKGGVLTAHSLAIRVESLSFMPGFALGMAASTLAGQYIGASSKTMAESSVRRCWIYAVVLMGGAGVMMFIFAEQLVGLLMPQSSAYTEKAVDIIRIFAFAQPFFATSMVMKMSMRGTGATGIVMLYSFGSMILMRVILLGWYVHRDVTPSLEGAWLIMISDMVLQASIFTWLHYRGRWAEVEV